MRSKIDYAGAQIESKLPMDKITVVATPLLRKRDISEAIAENESNENALTKCLGPIDLTAIGVGCIIFLFSLICNSILY